MIACLLFALVAVCVFRFICWAYMRMTLKRRKYEQLVAGKSFFDKWFFVSLRREAKNQFSKYEKRTIYHAQTARLLFTLNILNHLLLFAYLLFSLIAIYQEIAVTTIEEISMCFYGIVLLELLIFALITGQEDQRFHRERTKRKEK